MSTPFRLTDIERRSALWQRLNTHLLERLTAKRRANDQPQPHEETAALRGRIAELKYLTEEIVRPPTQSGDGE